MAEGRVCLEAEEAAYVGIGKGEKFGESVVLGVQVFVVAKGVFVPVVVFSVIVADRAWATEGTHVHIAYAVAFQDVAKSGLGEPFFAT